MKSTKKKITHIDCTLRDGGYYNNWDFPLDLVHKYLNAAKTVGIDFVEIGFRFFGNTGYKGPYAYSKDGFLDSLDIPKGLNLAIMINGVDLIVDGQFSQKVLDKLIPVPASKSKINLIRIACNLEDFQILIPVFKLLSEKGYMTAVNLMKISNAKDFQLNQIGLLANKSQVDVLYFADSLGSLDPKSIKHIIDGLRTSWEGEIGFHSHDNKGFALINSLKAIEHGVSWIDSTVSGIGRGAGNVRTEQLVLELEKDTDDFVYLIPLLKILNKYFNPMKKKYEWGPNPYYHLASKYSIHPSYIQTIITDNRFVEEDILSIIEYFKEEQSTNFIPDQLEIARNFYYGEPKGSIYPEKIINNREVLIIGSGENILTHRYALELFIKTSKPLVICLNEKTQINENYIDFRIASNPTRLMIDLDKHLKLPQPLITPASMLPEHLASKLSGKEVLDYGICISKNGFEFHETYGVIPSQIVFAYALAFVSSGKAKNVFLAGFDGFGFADPRDLEINKLLQEFNLSDSGIDLISITPTEYVGLKLQSIYGM